MERFDGAMMRVTMFIVRSVPVSEVFVRFCGDVGTFREVARFKLRTFRVSTFNIVPSSVFRIVYGRRTIVSRGSASRATLFMIMVVAGAMSSYSVIVFLFGSK